ncbi:beta strand repeat-containing protein [Microbacterium sp. NPDC016588]
MIASSRSFRAWFFGFIAVLLLAGVLLSAAPSAHAADDPGVAVTGNPVVGGTLTVTPGGWGTAPVNLSYQWQRDGQPIAGATGTSYTLTTADAGKSITALVTGTRQSTAVTVGAAFTTVPVPTITGTLQSGKTLTAVTGTWAPVPDAFAYQWAIDGTAVSGATTSAFVLRTADAGKKVTVTVTGTKAGYTPASATSTALTVLRPFTTAPLPTISGTPTSGSTLTADPGSWTPTAQVTYQWYRGSGAISGATAKTYVVVDADRGQKITVRTTGSASGYVTTTKASTEVLILNTFTATPAPTVTGTLQAGQTLTAATGAWTPAPDSSAYQWAVDGAPVSGATAAQFVIPAGAAGKTVTVVVSGSKVGYASASATSVASTILFPFTKAPVPSVTGAPEPGGTLTATVGTWQPTATLKLQWYRGATAISGATKTTYPVVEADRGQVLTVRVTGTRTGYITTEVASAGVTVPLLFTSAPAPSIVGTAQVGQAVSVDPGPWAPAPTSYTYQWLIGGAPIAGATGNSYTPVAGDGGKSLSVTVTAVKDGYKSQATTSAGAPVIQLLTGTPIPKISGTPVVGEKLTATAGTWTPAPVTLAYQWQRDGVAIAGATATTYTTVAADKGKTLTVQVTGTKAGYATVTATSIGQRVWQLKQVSGDLTANATWSSAAGDLYVLDGGLTVPKGKTLTIAEGTVVKSAGGWIDVSGSLIVNGTSAATVTFTSAQDDAVGGDTNGDKTATKPQRGDWNGIYAEQSATITVKETRIAYAGTGITANSAKPLTVTNVRIDNSSGDAAFVGGTTVDVSNWSGLTGSGNALNGVRLNSPGLVGTLAANPTFPWVADSSGVASGKALTISAGAVVKSTGSWLDVYGSLTAAGTTASPVVLTSLYDDAVDGDTNADGKATLPDRGAWSGVYVEPGASLAATSLRISYASTGINVPTPKKLELTDVQIDKSSSEAVSIGAGSVDAVTLTRVTGSGNGTNGIRLNGEITGTVKPATGLAYVFDGVVVPAGKSLTLAAGTVVKVSGSWIDVSGSLVVAGTSAAPVRLTAWDDDSVAGDTNGDGASAATPGSWTGIYVEENGSLTATGMSSSYAGTAVYGSNAKTVSVTASTISDTSYEGISATAGQTGVNQGARTVSITGNTIARTGSTGINVNVNNAAFTGSPQPVPVVTGNTVTGAGGNAIEIAGSFDPTKLSGNTGSANGGVVGNAVAINGELSASATLGSFGTAFPLVVNNWLTIPKGVTLTLSAGTAIKVVDGGGISVSGKLVGAGTTASPVVLTSINDDAVLGDTNNNSTSTKPTAGQWQGVYLDAGSSYTAGVLSIRYAGSSTPWDNR